MEELGFRNYLFTPSLRAGNVQEIKIPLIFEKLTKIIVATSTTMGAIHDLLLACLLCETLTRMVGFVTQISFDTQSS